MYVSNDVIVNGSSVRPYNPQLREPKLICAIPLRHDFFGNPSYHLVAQGPTDLLHRPAIGPTISEKVYRGGERGDAGVV